MSNNQINQLTTSKGGDVYSSRLNEFIAQLIKLRQTTINQLEINYFT